MKRILIAGLALALSAGGALAEPPQSSPLDQAYRDDVTCAVAYMSLAARGEDANAAALGFYYFIGRLQGRRPDVDWRSHVVAAATASGRDAVLRDGQRCGQILVDEGQSMGPIDEVVERWSGAQEPASEPTSGW